jgi:hypothetical protein
MKIKLDELPKHLKAINPHLFSVAGLQVAKPEPVTPQALDGRRPRSKKGPRIVVGIVSFRRRTTDQDNHIGGSKYLVDSIASSLGIDDADSRVRWEYAQVQTRGREGTAIRIDIL